MLFKRCEHGKKAWLSCEHPWWVQVKRHRQRIRESLEVYFPKEVVRGKGSKSLAQDLERQFMVDVRSGKYAEWKASKQPGSIPMSRTWSEFCDFYIEEHIIANGLRWDHTYKHKMKTIRQEWAGRRVDSIRVADVQTFLNKFKKRGCAPATVKYHYSIVHNMLRFAEKMQWIERSPLGPDSIELPKGRNERTRRMTDEEEERLFVVLDAMEDEAASDTKPARRFIKSVVTMTLDTGLRRGSILALQFKMFKRDQGRNGILDVPARILKQRRPQQLALTERARQVLDARKRFYFAQGKLTPDTFVFGKDDGTRYLGTCSFEQAWQEAKRRAGLKDADLHFHDLRGEAASRLHDLGMPLATIQRFLGHSSLEMTQRYLRARVGETEDTASVLDRYHAGRQRATKGATVGQESATNNPR
jgi:integrase